MDTTEQIKAVSGITSSDIAVMIVVIGFVFDKFWNLLRAKGVDLKRMADQIQVLTEQHSQTDDDGVPVWYFRKSYADTLESIGKSLGGINILLERMVAIEEDRTKR